MGEWVGCDTYIPTGGGFGEMESVKGEYPYILTAKKLMTDRQT